MIARLAASACAAVMVATPAWFLLQYDAHTLTQQLDTATVEVQR